jgi:flagellar motor switch protein FliG
MIIATGEEKAALLLKSLSPEMAEAVLARLPVEQSERLRRRLVSLGASASKRAVADQVLKEFQDLLRTASRLKPATSGERLPAAVTTEARAAAVAAYEAAKLQPEIQGSALTHQGVSHAPATAAAVEPGEDPIAALRRVPMDRLALALQSEHPRTIAIVLSRLSAAEAGEVLKRLPTETRADVSLRLGQGVQADRTLLGRIAQVLVQRAGTLTPPSEEGKGDAKFKKIADMLRALEKSERLEVLTVIEQNDPDLAAKVKDFLYQFQDLLLIEDRSMQKLLSEIDSKNLAIALKNAPEDLTEKVLRNLSKRARETLSEEMEFLGTVTAAQKQQAQKAVVEVIQRLDQSGELVMT